MSEAVIAVEGLTKRLNGRLVLDDVSFEVMSGEIFGFLGPNGAGQKVGAFSTGMLQRLGIAAALLEDPAILILDEPTSGLDPNGVREFRELVRSCADEGRTVFMSSHQLLDVEMLCSRVVLID